MTNQYGELVGLGGGTGTPAVYAGSLVPSGGGLVAYSQPSELVSSQVTGNASSQPGTTGTQTLGLPTPGDIANAITSNIPGLSGLEAVGQFFQNASGLLPALGKAFSKLTSAQFWKGLGLVALAVPLVIVGLILWTGHGGDAAQVAKGAAKAAPEAAEAA